jgi:hypothetical protein
MSSACERNGEPFTLRYQWLKTFTLLTDIEIDEMIDFFVEKNALRVTRASVAQDSHGETVLIQQDTHATDGRTDGRDETIAHAVRFDFESLYLKYPRKQGKGKGLARCKAQVKTQEDYNALSRAIDKYRMYCLKEKTERQFIKHFSTFMSEWRDWLDSDVGAVALTGPSGANCTVCKGGIIRAIKRSSGASELTACLCELGRSKSSYVRFDATKFDIATGKPVG